MIRRAQLPTLSLRLIPSRLVFSRLVLAVLAAGLVAGCDKCGNRVKFHAPSLPDACGENADPAR